MPNDSSLTAERPTSAGHRDRCVVTAILVPATEEARQALGGKASVRVATFPFKVGRESRSPGSASRIANFIELRLRKAPQLNDLYLIEPPSHSGFHISREHFAIDRFESELLLIDRGSACGTCVGDRAVGSDSKDSQTTLHDGDLIIVGSSRSPYRFQVRLSSDAT